MQIETQFLSWSSFTSQYGSTPHLLPMTAETLAVAIDKLRSLGQGTVKYDPQFAPGIGFIAIDNPDRHNAFSGKMMVEFYEIVVQIEQQELGDLVALIVSGAPQKSFCAGLDLTFALEHMKEPGMAAHVNHLMHNALSIFARLPLITVASVAGTVLGGGTELLTAFDYTCMASTTFIHFVQAQMGITSPWGGARRLVSRIGRKNALLVLGSVPKIDAQMAKQLGLADVVVEVEEEYSSQAYHACIDASVNFLHGFVFDDRTGGRLTPGAVRGMKKLIVRADLEQDEAFETSVLAEIAGSSKI